MYPGSGSVSSTGAYLSWRCVQVRGKARDPRDQRHSTPRQSIIWSPTPLALSSQVPLELSGPSLKRGSKYACVCPMVEIPGARFLRSLAHMGEDSHEGQQVTCSCVPDWAAAPCCMLAQALRRSPGEFVCPGSGSASSTRAHLSRSCVQARGKARDPRDPLGLELSGAP